MRKTIARLLGLPRGFEARTMYCYRCGDKDVIDVDTTSTDEVEKWLARHDGCIRAQQTLATELGEQRRVERQRVRRFLK